MSSPSPELLLALSPPMLRALVATFGPIAGLRPSAPPLAIVRAIFEGRAPAKLARVLAEVVARFSTETGRRAIVEAGRATKDERVEAWLAMPAADVAVGLAIERATRRELRRTADMLFALAGLRLERELAERATYELLAEAPARVAAAKDAVGGAIARAFADRVHDTWTHEENDGAIRVAVFLRLPVATRLGLEGGAIAQRIEAPIAVDLVRVHPAGARVSLTLAMPELLPRYARALGLTLRPSFTLKPLHDVTAEKLARVKVPRGVRALTLVGRRRRRPDGSRHEVRAFDVLDAADAETAARSGYVDRATLRAVVREQGIDAFLQLPHRVEISEGAAQGAREAMREVLAALGTFEPGATPDDARSLAPYEHGEWRWRIVVGDDGWGALVAGKRLIRVIAAHVVSEEHRMHGAGYVVRDVPGQKGAEYALAEDRSLGARLVGKKDRVAWRLDLGALADAMRRDLGAVAVGKPAAIEVEGVIDLGVVALPSGRLRFVYAMGTPAKGWLGAVAKGCGIGVSPVVLVPRGHAAGIEGVTVVELDVGEQLGVKGVGRVLGKAAEALGVAGEVEPWRIYDEEVLVDAKSGRVWVSRVLVALSEKAYRFVEYLARNAGRTATTKEIGGYVSSSEYPDDAARRIRVEVERQVTRGLTAAGADVGIVERLIVGEGRLGYRMGVSVRVV